MGQHRVENSNLICQSNYRIVELYVGQKSGCKVSGSQDGIKEGGGCPSKFQQMRKNDGTSSEIWLRWVRSHWCTPASRLHVCVHKFTTSAPPRLAPLRFHGSLSPSKEGRFLWPWDLVPLATPPPPRWEISAAGISFCTPSPLSIPNIQGTPQDTDTLQHSLPSQTFPLWQTATTTPASSRLENTQTVVDCWAKRRRQIHKYALIQNKLPMSVIQNPCKQKSQDNSEDFLYVCTEKVLCSRWQLYAVMNEDYLILLSHQPHTSYKTSQ